MAMGPMKPLFRNLRRALGLGAPDGPSDGELLEQYLASRDESAFTALVERHGPMVLGVCQRVLHDMHEAEDAFQATFLVLVRKAASIVPREMVGNWLYGVACRTALHARALNAKRRAKETEMREIPQGQAPSDETWRDLRPLLDSELQHLPDKYRASVVLCDLEGKSRTEAARQLGLAEGTLSSRLARARDMLAQRLQRRGVTLTAAVLATGLAQEAQAAVPKALLASTVQTATLFATNPAAVAGPVSILAEGVLHTMVVSKLKIAAALLMAVAVVGTGAGVAMHRALADKKPEAPAAAADKKPAPAEAPKPGDNKKNAVKPNEISGTVMDVSADGKSITLDIVTSKSEPAKQVTFKIGDKTEVVYFGVGTDEARPTKGFQAAVLVQDGAPETATHVRFTTKGKGKGTDIAGPVVAVGDGGKSFTIEAQSKNKGEPGQRVEVRIGTLTATTYFSVPAGGAKPTEGYNAQVWKSADAKNEFAASIQFSAGKKDGFKGAPAIQPELNGTVVAVADGGKQITVEVHSKVKGEQPTRTDIRLTDKTETTFSGVGPDGAKPEQGQTAQVWLEGGTKDSAIRIYFGDKNKDKGPDVQGKLLDVKDGGKRFSVEVPSKDKGSPPRTVEVTVSDRTHIGYFGVGPDGARPTPGYSVQAWLIGEGKDEAAQVHFSDPTKEKGGGDKGKPAPEDKKPEKGKPDPKNDDNPKKPKPAADDPKNPKPAPDDKKPEKGKPEPKNDDNPKKPKPGADDPKNPKPAPDDKKPEKGKPEPKNDDNPKKPKPGADDPKNPKPAVPGDKGKGAPQNGDDPKNPKPGDKGKGEPKPGDNPKNAKPAAGDKGQAFQQVGQKVEVNPFADERPGEARQVAPVAAAIDREIDRRLAEAHVSAAAPADDAEFLRRVSLDLTGRIPTLQRTVAFLDSTAPDKRGKLIDELLAHPGFGRHLADLWSQRLAPSDPSVNKAGPERFTPWLAEQFNRNRGWDHIVIELLTVEGEERNQPQSAFVMANGTNGQPLPNQLAAATGRLFLGVQIQCAECHDHPFTSWKQADFWGMAAFFGRTRAGGKNEPRGLTERPDPNPIPAKDGGVDRPAVRSDGAIVIPATGGNKGARKVVPAKFLDGQALTLDDKPLRPRFASWVTARENKYFARAFVNRTWAQFLGRGFVQPVDNFYDANPPSHPALLALLADEFRASAFDIKHLIRCICNSQAYQRTSRPLPGHEKDDALFSRVAVKVMDPEAFYDSLSLLVDVSKDVRPPAPTDSGAGKKLIARPPRDEFLHFFRGPSDAAEAGELSHGPPHFLRRMNSQLFNSGSPLIDHLVATESNREAAIEKLYLATLSRRPSAEETRLMTAYLTKRADAQQGYAGVLWILLNSGEFVLNH
jgi:RNA polymerase sigma factor (sigma-70 family)